jgi:hypothetical protein
LYRWVQRFTPLLIDAARPYRQGPTEGTDATHRGVPVRFNRGVTPPSGPPRRGRPASRGRLLRPGAAPAAEIVRRARRVAEGPSAVQYPGEPARRPVFATNFHV